MSGSFEIVGETGNDEEINELNGEYYKVEGEGKMLGGVPS